MLLLSLLVLHKCLVNRSYWKKNCCEKEGFCLRVSATAGAVGTPDQSPKAHNFTRVFSEEDKSSDEIKNNVGRQQQQVLATTKE